jgi:hypothetical protein
MMKKLLIPVCLLIFACPDGAAAHAQTLADYSASIDRSCESDGDCTVKDVHNCCGYYPGCVNVNAKTDPDKVRTLCEAEGLAGVCGFEDISACRCDQGSCVSAQETGKP